MKVFVRIFLFLSFSSLMSCQLSLNDVDKIEVVCASIEDAIWPPIGSYLTCKADKSMKSEFSDSSVSRVVHSNRSEVKNIAEITALSVEHATSVNFIPFGIKSHFSDLKVLLIYSCNLLSVSKENLRQFGSSLEFLSVQSNKLTSIDANLFEYNPNLKVIWLYNNPISHIDPEFFTSLKKLKKIQNVDLSPVKCMDQSLSSLSGHNITSFKWKNENCTDIAAKDEAKNIISNNVNNLRAIIANLRNEIIKNDKNAASNSTSWVPIV